jgi:hypothetical protein
LSREMIPLVLYGEFLWFIGLWFLMATQQGAERRYFWSTSPPDHLMLQTFA